MKKKDMSRAAGSAYGGKLKSGDKVKVIAGKNKGKKGKVLQVLADRNRASVEGINLAIKYLKPRRQGEKGQKIEFPAPLNISNLMMLCPKCNKAARIRYKFLKQTGEKNNNKVRICSQCKELID